MLRRLRHYNELLPVFFNEIGQKLKSSTRADDFRFAANSGPDGSIGNQDFQFLRGPQLSLPKGSIFAPGGLAAGSAAAQPKGEGRARAAEGETAYRQQTSCSEEALRFKFAGGGNAARSSFLGYLWAASWFLELTTLDCADASRPGCRDDGI